MLDLRWIRDNPEAFDAALKRRRLDSIASELLRLDAEHRAVQTELQAAQARRNEASKQIGAAKAKGGDAAALVAEVATLKDRLPALEQKEREFGRKVAALLETIPNAPAPDVPDGPDASANIELRVVGQKPGFNFKPKDHAELGEALGLMDFERAAKLSGSRFVVLSGALARLERALAAFMLDIHSGEFGYTEVNPPLLVRDEVAFGTGQLPKFADDLFRTTTGFWLIPTAEVSLTNLVANEILDEAVLPLRYTAHTPCFRSEAGAAGKDTRGMLRQHQFNKVELVSIAHPDKSEAEHERMTAAAEEVLKRLELCYRVVVLSTGDMGFSARKTYDIEVWLPGQDTFREISSCSNCGDFQARRMKARFRPTGGKGTQFVHTLNGSGLAVGRTLIAVMENYQRQDGSIAIPPALVPYMGGLDAIGPGRSS
jgi:seryl-tRNA synthetase